MKKYLLLFLTLNIVTFSIELTLDKSIDLAKKNNRQLKEKNITIKQKKLNENVKIKNALPSLRAQTIYIDHDESKNLNSSFQNGIYLSQPIFTGGELYYNIKSSKALREFEENDYITQNINLELNVIQTYISCLQLKKTLNVYKTSQKEKQEELKKQQEFYNLSLIDKSEVLKIETSLYQTETSILKIKNNIIAQELTLKNLLGLNIEENIILKEMNFSNFMTINIDLKKDTERALSNSTLSKKLDKNILISEYNSKSNRSSFLPKVDLEYGYESLEESSFSKSNNDWEWRVGITFKWDIFNFGSGIDSYKESTLEIEKQKISKIDSLEILKKQIKTAYLDLITAKEVIITNEKALLTAFETFKIDKEKFSNRIIDSVDFLKSESQLREAQITHINSQLDYFLYYQQYLSLLK
ncbi:TolC family protein [Cetobacterium somerae]|uniref:TolC family protein n=1 Tax=Cetobacterium sp. NK01 TaxID=2993530 RepID=UPI0021160C64|nr:TolC family protein [Cetobacterium sp. NK01]MCQ8213573.1 TolC family protein [Cetobacterium sp. NK01]